MYPGALLQSWNVNIASNTPIDLKLKRNGELIIRIYFESFSLPDKVDFEELVDLTSRPEEGIRYYSGNASCHKTFDLSTSMDIDEKVQVFLNLGEVNNMASVILNGKDLGVVWTAPWQVNVRAEIKESGLISLVLIQHKLFTK